MTDPTHSPDDLDEVLSAILDGEADDAARAGVASDPTAKARLEELRAARDLVAIPVPPLDEVTARRLRQTAISSASPATFPAKSHRRKAAGRWIASAAAVLLLLVVAVPVLSQLGGDDSDDSASEALDSGDESAESPDAAQEATAGADAAGDDALESSDDGGAELATAPSTILDLGDYSTDQAFRDAVLGEEGDEFPDQAEPPSPDELGRDLMDALDATQSQSYCSMQTPSGVVASFRGTVEGEARLAWVVRDEDAALSVLVFDPATCEVVTTTIDP